MLSRNVENNELSTEPISLENLFNNFPDSILSTVIGLA